MKIKMNENLATPTTQYTMGQEYDLPDDEAERLIQGGIATDPSGKVQRKHPKPDPKAAAAPKTGRQTLDRKTGLPVESVKLPSSLGLPNHPNASPDPVTGLNAGTAAALNPAADVFGTAGPAGLAPASGGVAATNAPSPAATAAAHAGETPAEAPGKPGTTGSTPAESGARPPGAPK